MHTIDQLEKQQVGLRLPKYLVEEIDSFTKQYNINRTDIIIEAIRSYINEQKTKDLYRNFDNACKELNLVISGNKNKEELQSLEGLLDELKDN